MLQRLDLYVITMCSPFVAAVLGFKVCLMSKNAVPQTKCYHMFVQLGDSWPMCRVWHTVMQMGEPSLGSLVWYCTL
jgi:hypothetical protein